MWRLDSSGETGFFFFFFLPGVAGVPVQSISFFFSSPLPKRCVRRITFGSDVLFAALFLGHCLFRANIKMQLTVFPGTWNHLLAFGGRKWQASSTKEIHLGRHHAVWQGSVAESRERGFVLRWTWVWVLVLLLSRFMTWISYLSSLSLSFLICK